MPPLLSSANHVRANGLLPTSIYANGARVWPIVGSSLLVMPTRSASEFAGGFFTAPEDTYTVVAGGGKWRVTVKGAGWGWAWIPSGTLPPNEDFWVEIDYQSQFPITRMGGIFELDTGAFAECPASKVGVRRKGYCWVRSRSDGATQVWFQNVPNAYTNLYVDVFTIKIFRPTIPIPDVR